MCAYVKMMLQSYQGALKNLEILMSFNWTMVSFSRCMEMSKRCWKIIKEPWRTLTKLMFLNQMMHALWACMEMLKGCWKTIKECWRTLIKFGFSWGSTIIAIHYAYPNLLNKGIDPLWMQIRNCSDYSFGFCWSKWKFSHGGWCFNALESSSCASRREKAWRNIAGCECFPIVVRRRTVRKHDVYLNRSFSMGSSIFS